VAGLMDTAPDGLTEQIKRTVEAVPGVADCHQIRVRTSRPRLFADIHVLMDGNLSLNAAHVLTDQIEQAIHQIDPNLDVTVHAEPSSTVPTKN
jgi:ferrous-iron efflux pump FieF